MGMEDAMENTIQLHTQNTVDQESLYAASLILQDVHALIQGIHVLVAILLRYVEIGTAITNSLVQLGTPVLAENS